LADGQLVSVISLFGQGPTAQSRKFAVEPTEQGKGHGSRLLGHLVEAAQQMGVQLLWCNACTSAIFLYEKFGFVTVSGSFWQHGTEYVRMERIF